jgi:hypothetical protein
MLTSPNEDVPRVQKKWAECAGDQQRGSGKGLIGVGLIGVCHIEVLGLIHKCSIEVVGLIDRGQNVLVINRGGQVNTYTHIHIHSYTHTYIYTYTHIHIYSYTHIHIYTY